MSHMYKASLKKRIFRVLVVLVLVAAVTLSVVYRGPIARFLLYLNSRVSQQGAGEGQGSFNVFQPRIIIHKELRKMQLLDGDRLVRTYRIGLGFSPVGHKEREGDGKTPEGEYFICSKNPESRFHLALGLSYPNANDAQQGLEAGLISEAEFEQITSALRAESMPPWNTPLGGEIMIHGHGSKYDWTAGCIALDDAAIDELYNAVPLGTPVEINP